MTAIAILAVAVATFINAVNGLRLSRRVERLEARSPNSRQPDEEQKTSAQDQ